jgi:peptidoglycan hydrolase-like protein with peptidoglycan-binding domain
VRRLAPIVAAAALVLPAAAHGGVNPQIAGLQVALRAHGLYLAQIDGVAGPRTAAAIHRFQRQHGLPVGYANTRTRIALGPLGRPLFGSRVLKRGDFGLDVSVLQFLLTRRGYYAGALDGYMGAETTRALERYQRALDLRADAVLGPRTLAAIVRRDDVPVSRPSAPAAAPVASLQIHVVKEGETLTAIAAAAHTTIAKLASLNHIDAARPILIGQKLRVPVAASLAPSRSDVRAELDAWSSRLGVDPHLVRALAWMESGYQTRIVSDAGARGVLQTLPTTRAYVETVLVGHPVARTVSGDIEVGVLYLRHLLQVFHGDRRLALAGWYQGERAVRAHGLYLETKPFVSDVLALSTRM